MADIKPSLVENCVTTRHGVAGTVMHTALVQYPGEDARPVEFIGSEYGGPVTMRFGPIQEFVLQPERFGAFSEKAWVLRFYGVTA